MRLLEDQSVSDISRRAASAWAIVTGIGVL